MDIVGFTPYAEQSDPEQVRGLQQTYFNTVRNVVRQYGGVVEKYIGDAVMVLFGAPVATETDALRCVRTGLVLQRVLAREAPEGGGPTFRVGIATGEALVDVAAARDGGQAIVAGDVVITASRLQAAAPPGGLLVCGTTRAATRAAIRYDAHEPIRLRGRSATTEVWLAVAPIPARRSDSESNPTPLIDREHELGVLINALHRTFRDRVPQLVTVLGRAGIGKSRLIREVFRHVERLPEVSSWRTGHCPPFGENVTYAALADIVKAEAGILDTDTAEDAAAHLDAALADLVGADERDRLATALRPLVGLPAKKLPAEEAESAWRRFLIAVAVRGAAGGLGA